MSNMAANGTGVGSYHAIQGCILGTAVGDALGLPYEGLSATRAGRMLGPPERFRFVFGRGMISDDTEHTCMVARCLIDTSHVDAVGAIEDFSARFATKLRWWILALPAGVGAATARAGFKLWFGAKPATSGVFSAGNGPAMRSAILGAAVENVVRMQELVWASTQVTHTDPKAAYGAVAVAYAARHACQNSEPKADAWLKETEAALGEEADELIGLLRRAVESTRSRQGTADFAKSIGQQGGISGYVYHTVPVAIHAWLSHPKDYPNAVQGIIKCGGDADTTAAIVGGILGAGVGRDGIPSKWLETLCEWPRSITWMDQIAEELATDCPNQNRSLFLNPVAVLVRNLFFLCVVLWHGFRRLAPPY